MTYVQPITSPIPQQNKKPAYNGVKIKVDSPKVNIANASGKVPDLRNYSAVDIEVGNPELNIYNAEPKPHQYAQEPYVRPYLPQSPVPIVPVAYINRTIVSAEFDIPEAKISEPEEPVDIVHVPNYTTTEAEKTLTFHGAPKVEVVPAANIVPEGDIAEVIANLRSNDYDVQALQMEEITLHAMTDKEKAIPYILTDVFSSLVDIVKADTSDLTPPDEKKNEIRKKIIINEVVKDQAIAAGQDPASVELPFDLSDAEIKEASALTTMEMAERNKEYGIFTMASLAKIYIDEVEKATGNVVPLTDIPGVSVFVDTLRYSENGGVKIAALDGLRYLSRSEYNEELKAIFLLCATDENPYVASHALMALESLIG